MLSLMEVGRPFALDNLECLSPHFKPSDGSDISTDDDCTSLSSTRSSVSWCSRDFKKSVTWADEEELESVMRIPSKEDHNLAVAETERQAFLVNVKANLYPVQTQISVSYAYTDESFKEVKVPGSFDIYDEIL